MVNKLRGKARFLVEVTYHFLCCIPCLSSILCGVNLRCSDFPLNIMITMIIIIIIMIMVIIICIIFIMIIIIIFRHHCCFVIVPFLCCFLHAYHTQTCSINILWYLVFSCKFSNACIYYSSLFILVPSGVKVCSLPHSTTRVSACIYIY